MPTAPEGCTPFGLSLSYPNTGRVFFLFGTGVPKVLARRPSAELGMKVASVTNVLASLAQNRHALTPSSADSCLPVFEPILVHIRFSSGDALAYASRGGEQKANTMRGQVALLKREIEAKLAGRIPAALSPLAQQTPRLYPIGNVRLDSLLGGGLPLGSVCELSGADGSGRSSLALSLLASASRESVCAYVDVSDTLSVHSAAAAGVELGNLLWVRFAAVRSSPVVVAATAADAKPLLDASVSSHKPIHGGCASSHPRGETKGLAPALERMLAAKEEQRRRKMEGTPGYPNQPLGLHTASQDQVDWERWNLRKVDETDPLRQMDRQAAQAAREQAASRSSLATTRVSEQKPWDRLGRALRATDQVLQSGGFRVIVLDLGSVLSKEALRIPSATWFRYRRAAQESDAILLLLTKEPCARSSAACVLQCTAERPPTIQGVLKAAERHAEIARQRSAPAFGKKAPGRATSWDGAPAWMRAAGG